MTQAEIESRQSRKRERSRKAWQRGVGKSQSEPETQTGENSPKESQVAKRETEVQDNLFPELDDSPEHKSLLKAARKYIRVKAARDEVLGIQKQEMDKAMEDVIAKMDAAQIPKFHHDSLTVEIIDGKRKVKVKIDDGEDESEDEESDE